MNIDLNDVLLGAVFLMLGAYASYYFSNRREISWIYSRRRVLDPASSRYPDGMEIMFDGVQIENLVEWKIAIWNEGNSAIRSEDFLTSPQFNVSFPNDTVLKVTEPVRSREIVGVEVLKAESSVAIEGVYVIDKGDWIVFDVYTSSLSEEEQKSKKILVESSIVNLPKGPSEKDLPVGNNWKERAAMVLTLCVYGAMAYWFGLRSYSELPDVPSGKVYSEFLQILAPEIAIIAAYIVLIMFSLFSIFIAFFVVISLFLFSSWFFGGPPDEVQKLFFKDNRRSFFRFGRIFE